MARRPYPYAVVGRGIAADWRASGWPEYSPGCAGWPGRGCRRSESRRFRRRHRLAAAADR